MLSRFILITSLTTLMFLSGFAEAATLSGFTDRTAWTENLVNPITEDFQDDQLQDGLSLTTQRGSIDGGVWNDVLTKGTRFAAGSTTVFSFSNAISYFGATWDIRPADEGTGIRLTFLSGGQEIGNQEIPYVSHGFWGVVSDITFDSVLLSHGSRFAYKETFTLDDLVFGTALGPQQTSSDLVQAPLPSAFWLFTSAALGMAFVRRRPTRGGLLRF